LKLIVSTFSPGGAHSTSISGNYYASSAGTDVLKCAGILLKALETPSIRCLHSDASVVNIDRQIRIFSK
jgi:hypothetical protein